MENTDHGDKTEPLEKNTTGERTIVLRSLARLIAQKYIKKLDTTKDQTSEGE